MRFRVRSLAAVAVAASLAALWPENTLADSKEPATQEVNRTLPEPRSDELTERARRLFDAIVSDDPASADGFFFPKEPFIPLKDVADPGRYFDGLLATYHRDVHALHARRRSWEGAVFQGFELGSKPRWVKPGEEWNKIGYYRSIGSKIHYEIGGRARVLEVRTVISWDGRWFVTHLLPVRRK